MDTTQWPEQGIGVVKVVPMEGDNNSSGAAAVNNNTKAIISAAAAPRPQKPQALNCPRCNSAHTKFCYYNNYSLTQPRYFCKTCRRYWTEGGSLRNVPVGGGSRKNKRCSSSSNPTIAASSSSSSLSKNIKLPREIITSNSQNPNSKIIFHDQGQDLNLAYPPTGPSTYNSTATGISEFVEFPSATSSHHQFSQLLKSGIGGRGSFTSFMSMIPVSDSSNNNSAAIYSSSSAGAGLPFQEFSKPITSGVNFSLDQQHGFESSGGGGGVYGSLQLGVHQESSGSNNHAKLFNFPFEDLKQQPVLLNSSTTSTQDAELMDQRSRGTTVTTTNTTQGDHHHHHQSPAGYWNNINGGGSW